MRGFYQRFNDGYQEGMDETTEENYWFIWCLMIQIKNV